MCPPTHQPQLVRLVKEGSSHKSIAAGFKIAIEGSVNFIIRSFDFIEAENRKNVVCTVSHSIQ